MKEEELKKYFNVYTYCWKLFRKYSEPVDDDEFWSNLISNADVIAKATENSEFARKIILATLDEIEKIYKESKK